MQQADRNTQHETDPIGSRREENSLQHFKDVLKDLLVMIRVSCDSDTASMYWINRKREQFVLETSSTILNDVVFQDRVSFEEFPLDPWKDIEEPVILEVGTDISKSILTHHMNGFPSKAMLLLPFINNGETVSITVVELPKSTGISAEAEKACLGYVNAVGNILRTYLELNDMFQDEKRWEAYDAALDSFNQQKSVIGILERMLAEACNLVQGGGACFISKGMSGWHVTLSNSQNSRPMPAGLKMSEASQSALCLKSGEPEFTLHFNGNPKRVSQKELPAEGASYVVPLMINYRRHGLLMVWDENPLVFRESMKHMISNMVRTVSMILKSDSAVQTEDRDLLTTETGSYKLEVIERVIDTELKRRSEGFRPMDTWLVFVTPADYQDLRAKLGSERIKSLQFSMGRDLNPNHSGVPGLVSVYTESIFAVVIQSRKENGVDNWIDYFKSYVAERARTNSDYLPDIKFHFGICKISESHKDAYTALQDAKRAMNYAVKRNVEIVQ